MPTRPRKPRDLAKVEAAVLPVDEFNGRLMRKLAASRREFFETIDRPP